MNAPAPTRVLLVDDEPSLREPLAEYLSRQGFVVSQAEDAAKARSALLDDAPDLVLLDIMMPGEDGLSLCRHLSESKNIPVILLTARGEATDRIVGLEIGADDYVVKPFEPRELVARIRVQAREKSPRAPELRAGGVALDTQSRACTFEGRDVPLAKMEFELLKLLVGSPGKVFTREELLNQRRDRFFSGYMVKAKEKLSININQEALARVVGPAPARAGLR